MSSLILFFLVVALLIVVAIIAERELINRSRPRAGDDGTLANMTNRWWSAVQRLGQDAGAVGRNLLTPSYKTLIPQFRTWIHDDLHDNETLRQWLLGLPQEGFDALTAQLVIFCGELNIELAWLLDGDLNRDPQVREVVRQIVVNYCDACYQAVHIQPNLSGFRRYADALDRLTGPDADKVGQALLARLRENNLAPPATPDLVLATDAERRDYALRIIREAATQDRDAFNRIWQDVVDQQQTSRA